MYFFLYSGTCLVFFLSGRAMERNESMFPWILLWLVLSFLHGFFYTPRFG